MGLRLIAPGKRKNNRYYLVRGCYWGRRIEMSTQTDDLRTARKFKARLEDALMDELFDVEQDKCHPAIWALRQSILGRSIAIWDEAHSSANGHDEWADEPPVAH